MVPRPPEAEPALQPTPERVPAAVLVNPRSFRSRRSRLGERVLAQARQAGVPALEADNPVAFIEGLHELLARRPEVLVIVGGDGTVQALTTELFRQDFTERLPALCLLPGGRTNLTAADVNRRTRTARALDNILVGGEKAGQSIIRPTLQIIKGDAPAQYGFFIAGALVDQVIRETHEFRQVSPRRDSSRIGAPLQVTRTIMSHLSGKSRLPAPTASVDAGKLGEFERPVRILLASSLQRIAPGIDPFADRGQGKFQFTAIASGAPRVWRRLPGLLRGQLPQEANARCGYISGLTNQVDIQGLESFSLDGEPIQVSPDETLSIRSGPDMRFLVA